MPGPHSPLPLVLFVALFGFAVYRRYRRTVGRQALVPRRLTFEVIVAGLFTLLLVLPQAAHLISLAAALAGLLGGGLVGLWGLRLTRFERTPDRDYYTPNTYLGLAVFGVFLARLAYRLVQVYPLMQSPPPPGTTPGMGGLTSSPLTLALFVAVIGYYLCYWAGVLLWYRRNPPGRSPGEGEGQPD